MNTEDRLAILDLIARYAHTFDAKDTEGWLSLFTENAVWEHFRAGTDGPVTRIVSLRELSAWATVFHNRTREEQTWARHLLTGTEFLEQTPDTARTRTTVLTTLLNPGSRTPQITIAGHYDFVLRKTSRGWMFAHCLLRNDIPVEG